MSFFEWVLCLGRSFARYSSAETCAFVVVVAFFMVQDQSSAQKLLTSKIGVKRREKEKRRKEVRSHVESCFFFLLFFFLFLLKESEQGREGGKICRSSVTEYISLQMVQPLPSLLVFAISSLTVNKYLFHFINSQFVVLETVLGVRVPPST